MTNTQDEGLEPFLRASEVLIFDRDDLLWVWDASVKQWRSVQRAGYPTKTWDELFSEYRPLSVYDGGELTALRESTRGLLIAAEDKRWPAQVMNALRALISAIDHVWWSPTREPERLPVVEEH